MTSDPSSSSIVLSFPSTYLGNKRTAFGQDLSLTLSLPLLPENALLSELKAYVELTSFVARVEPLRRYLFGVEINVSSSDPQEVKVRYSTG